MPRYLFIIANKLQSPLGKETPYDSFGALRYVGETLANTGYRGPLIGYSSASVYDFAGSTWEFSSPCEIDAGTRTKLEGYPGVTLKDL